MTTSWVRMPAELDAVMARTAPGRLERVTHMTASRERDIIRAFVELSNDLVTGTTSSSCS